MIKEKKIIITLFYKKGGTAPTRGNEEAPPTAIFFSAVVGDWKLLSA